MSNVTLHFGNCLDILPTLEPGSVDCVIADPPYGARRPSARRSVAERFTEVHGNDKPRPEWLRPAFDVLADGGAIYVFACWDRMEEWRVAMTQAGFRVRSCIVWDKGVHGLADLETCWAPQHEMILFGAKGRHELCGSRPADVIHCQRLDPAKMVHPYQKPSKLFARLVRASTDHGGTVLDPFMGSGESGLVAQQYGRDFIGIELDPVHYATAERRIEAERTRHPLFAGMAE